MIEINLLPSGAARRAPTQRALRSARMPQFGADPRMAGLAGAALLFVLVAGFTFWKSGTRTAALETEVESEVADSARLARTISMLGTLTAQKDTIEHKIDIIRGVDGRRYVWPHLMDEVSRAVPQYTWLTRIAAEEEADAPPPAAAPAPAPADTSKAKGDSAKADALVLPPEPEGPRFTIEGAAATTQALTRFMKNLEASPMIMGVTLVTSESTETQGRTYQKFTLEATYEHPDSALIESVPVLPVQ
ncbi:MAG TPA: PilN domain-containing protein [Longimicrobium sp.]|nr:PilN domain-containing protein [Longimicrobium sp.]